MGNNLSNDCSVEIIRLSTRTDQTTITVSYKNNLLLIYLYLLLSVREVGTSQPTVLVSYSE